MSETSPYPHAILSEKNVVSICIKDEAKFRQAVAEGIDKDAFYLPQTKLIFSILNEVPRGDDGETDLAVLVETMNERGILQTVGGVGAVAEIYSYAASASGWTHWLITLREHKARRLAIDAGMRLANTEDSQEAITSTRDTLAALLKAVEGRKRSMTIQEASRAFYEQFRADHENGDIPGKSTGIDQIDAISGGMRPGEFWVVAGKPSRGKSVLMLQIACEFIKHSSPVAVFSLEMMAREIVGRLVTTIGGIPHDAITKPRSANKIHLSRIKTTIDEIKSAPLWIDSSAGQTIDTIQVEAERIRDSHGSLSLVVVDYIQLIRGSRNRGESREEEIARASGAMKQLAKHLGCPVLSASQLNEQGQTRESRAIEQDADALIYIVDDGIKIGKLRSGPRDAVLPLHLNGAMQRFEA
jgi:replicative DNA helicase